MLFEELNTSKRMEDKEERKAGDIVKSDKKDKKIKLKKSSSISFSTYKTLKTVLTFALGSAIVLGLFYVFYIGIKVFVGG